MNPILRDLLFAFSVLVQVVAFAVFAYDSWRNEERRCLLRQLEWWHYTLLAYLALAWMSMGLLASC